MLGYNTQFVMAVIAGIQSSDWKITVQLDFGSLATFFFSPNDRCGPWVKMVVNGGICVPNSENPLIRIPFPSDMDQWHPQAATHIFSLLISLLTMLIQ